MCTKIFSQVILVLTALMWTINLWAMPSYDDVLVVVNDNSPQSLEIGAYFKNARQISDTNICHISLRDLQMYGGESAYMSIDERNSSISKIKQYIADNNLADKINYIVLTRGIPYFTMNDPVAPLNHQIFDLKLLFELSESATYNTIADIFTFNKYYYYIAFNYNNHINYKFTKKKYGYYIVARLDGPGVVNIKKMIDNTGYPACQSYKKPIKFLTMNPYSYSGTEKIFTEIKTRGNIQIVTPDIKNGEDMRDVGQNIMFAYLNRVEGAFTPLANVKEIFAPYYASSFYSDDDIVLYYPNIYTGLTFLPGSLITCFRSYPALYNHRIYGGMFKFDPATSKSNDYKKSDGSDMKFRHMNCIEYDPVNDWIWCGTGDSPLRIVKGYSAPNVSDITVHKYEARRGGGIAIYDANGNILNHLNIDNSPLRNNRVTKVAYDKYAKRMWVAHYGGVQYYDLVNKTWSEIPELKNDFAATCGIYVDPYDTDKVYFAFYSTTVSNKKRGSSLLPNADTSIFEYSKSAKGVKTYLIEDKVVGRAPLIAKTSPNTAWITKDVYSLYKYDLKSAKVLEKIDIPSHIPEIAALITGDTYTLNPPSSMISLPGANVILVGISCYYKYKAGNRVAKNYVLRVTDNGDVASTVELINSDLMNRPSSGIAITNIWSLITDPLNTNTVYMSFSDSENSTIVVSAILKSADQGKTWAQLPVPAVSVVNLREITVDSKGVIYGVRGYELGQQNFSDFMAFGACAFGGGLSHETFTYNPNPATASTIDLVPVGAYSSNTSAEQEAYGMMLMLLDGYYYGEARFGIFKNYPKSGSGGYEAHMLVFEPKCAPYAPRVDEENLNPMIQNKQTIEIPLRSPGLPLTMDGFIPETINSSTVSVKDELGNPVSTTIQYVAPGNKIVLTGVFSGTAYLVTLKCGVDGIKNIKGASLVNTRADEFKDEITYTFGISTEIYTPPADVTGPVKMPSTNSKCDLIVSKVWWTTVPVVGQPLTVNFDISNIGTVKTAAGTGIQKAKVYLNNVLTDVKAYNDIAPKGKVSLTATIPGASVVGGKQSKVMVWADAMDKVAEIRETNNTNSASFMIETRPDLIVKEITLSPKPKAKAPLTITFKISNIGASATASGAGIQVATVFVDGKSVGTVAYNDAPKGGSIAKQLVLPDGIATAGVHKIKVVADTNKIVDEISELNNALEKSFSIAK